MAARATVEALLREKKLDRTLTSALPERLGEDAVAPLDIRALDRGLAGWASPQGKEAGGLPRGQVSEVVGPASSGRTSVAWAALAAATRRGESVALIDTFDRFDPPTAKACGIELSRVLWVRGQAVSKTTTAIDPAWLSPSALSPRAGGPKYAGVRGLSGPSVLVERVIDRAIKALNLVVQSGVCTLVVVDLIDVPANALRRLPASTWFRVERAIENSDTAVLILTAIPVSRSTGGRSIVLEGGPGTGNRERGTGNRESVLPAPGSRLPAPVWRGDHDRSRRLAGVRVRADVNAARWSQTQPVDLETRVINAV